MVYNLVSVFSVTVFRNAFTLLEMMSMVLKETILIIEDKQTFRDMLRDALQEEYNVIEAENRKQASKAIKDNLYSLSLIMLDDSIKGVNCFDVISTLQSYSVTAAIPIFLITNDNSYAAEQKVFEHGAVGIAHMPIKPELLRSKVQSILKFRDVSFRVSAAKHDRLTGIFSKEYFYTAAGRLLKNDPDKDYDIMCTDIQHFKVINDQYGTDASDYVLWALAERINNLVGESGVCGRIGADIFAMLIPRKDYDEQQKLMDDIVGGGCENGISFTLKFGIYPITDRTVPVSAMCDRALIVMGTIKHSYDARYAVYDEKIRQSMLREQQILDSMDEGIRKKQFTVYLQPKHNTETGVVEGAEALVRWIHPRLGFISPGDFIPLFEKNGFITKLDSYVWEMTCRIIRGWIDEGISPIPVSVNMSRVDLETDNVISTMDELVAKYDIPRELLHLEVTESVYEDDSARLVDVVGKLKDDGYTIEMDDFGSGYSSLSMLSELPIDVLKLDMGLIRSESRYSNKKGVMSFVLSMARWMGFKTIAEGVEKKDEVDFLRSIGCDLIQGFYFAKPMPSDDFKSYMMSHNKIRTVGTKKEKIGSGVNPEKKYSILVIDDSKFNQEFVRKVISVRYNLLFASNGVEGMQILEKSGDQISLIMLDLMMPVMDGFQFLTKYTKMDFYNRIPVIVMSESGSKSEALALSLGAEDYIAKPFSPEVMMLRVDKAFSHIRRESKE